MGIFLLFRRLRCLGFLGLLSFFLFLCLCGLGFLRLAFRLCRLGFGIAYNRFSPFCHGISKCSTHHIGKFFITLYSFIIACLHLFLQSNHFITLLICQNQGIQICIQILIQEIEIVCRVYVIDDQISLSVSLHIEEIHSRCRSIHTFEFQIIAYRYQIRIIGCPLCGITGDVLIILIILRKRRDITLFIVTERLCNHLQRIRISTGICRIIIFHQCHKFRICIFLQLTDFLIFCSLCHSLCTVLCLFLIFLRTGTLYQNHNKNHK